MSAVIEWARVSPVPTAAAMIIVESISPTTIRIAPARRRGMLRTPSLKMTGRRHATHATERRHRESRAIRVSMIPVIGTPKISSMIRFSFCGGAALVRRGNGTHRGRVERCGLPRPLLTDDLAVAHLHDAVTPRADTGVVGDDHQGQSLRPIELPHQVDDLGRGRGVERAGRLVG